LDGSQVTALAAIKAGVHVEAIKGLPIFALNMAAAAVTGIDHIPAFRHLDRAVFCLAFFRLTFLPDHYVK
jgi:hypothetical protein